MPVDSTHELYKEFAPQWDKVRTVFKGDEAVKAKGVEYVPAFASMYDTSGNLNSTLYDAYINQAVLTEIALKISTNANALPHAKLPVIEVPTALELLLEDVTLTGQSFLDLVKTGTQELFNVGRVCYLVDVAQRPQEHKGVFSSRPYVREYKTESVLDWGYTRINGVETLTKVVISEVKTVVVDEFESKDETIYKVLRLIDGVYTSQIYSKSDSGEITAGIIETPLNAAKSLNFIPFYGITPLAATLNPVKPPMIPVVNININHFMRSVDKSYQLHQMAVGTIVIFGVDDFQNDDGTQKPFNVGGSYLFPSSQGTQSAQILERTGDGIPSQEREIATLEERMYKLGIGMLQDDKNGVESYDTQNSRTATERAIVVSIADTASLVFTKILETMALWSGTSGEIKFSLNTDFIDIPMTVKDMVDLGSVNTMRPMMTDKEIFDYMVQGGAINENVKYEEHQTELQDADLSLGSESAIVPSNNTSDKSMIDGLG